MGCCLHTSATTGSSSSSRRDHDTELEERDRRLVRIALEPVDDDEHELSEIQFNQHSDSDSVDEEEYYTGYVTEQARILTTPVRPTAFPNRVLCQRLAMAREQANQYTTGDDVDEIVRRYGHAIQACSPAQLAIRKRIIREYESLKTMLPEPLAVPIITADEMLRTARDPLESESVRREFYRRAIQSTWNRSRAGELKHEYNHFLSAARVKNVIATEQVRSGKEEEEEETGRSANQ